MSFIVGILTSAVIGLITALAVVLATAVLTIVASTAIASVKNKENGFKVFTLWVLFGSLAVAAVMINPIAGALMLATQVLIQSTATIKWNFTRKATPDVTEEVVTDVEATIHETFEAVVETVQDIADDFQSGTNSATA